MIDQQPIGAAAELQRLTPLIYSLAAKSLVPLPKEDVRQEAMLAAWSALVRFDPTKGASTSTWVTSSVRGRLMDLTRNLRGRSGYKAAIRFQSIDAMTAGTSGCDEDTPLVALHDPRPGFRFRDRKERWRHLLRGFSRRDRIVALRYFVLKHSTRAIGECLGVSTMHVCYIVRDIVGRLGQLELIDGRVRELCT